MAREGHRTTRNMVKRQGINTAADEKDTGYRQTRIISYNVERAWGYASRDTEGCVCVCFLCVQGEVGCAFTHGGCLHHLCNESILSIVLLGHTLASSISHRNRIE